MGFRNNQWATVWEVKRKNDFVTQVRLSTNHKDKETGDYVQDFSGYVSFVGTAAAQKASKLQPKDRIQLVSVDVRTNYVKEKDTTYYNFSCYEFKTRDESQGSEISSQSSDFTAPQPAAVEGEVDDDKLPW